MAGHPEAAIRLTTYAELDTFVRAYASGAFNLLVLLGPPGLQKSRAARDALPDACWIEGHATALGIYTRLWEFRDQPVVIDDVDSLYSNPGAVRLLKCLCQTERRKTVAWESDAPALRRDNIPKRFTTSSRVLIIANAWHTLNANVTALEDRGHVVVFDPSAAEVHARTAVWFWDQAIFDWVGEHLHLIARPSMRTYCAAWELKAAGLDWKGLLLDHWLSGTRLLVARLKADASFATEEDRARAFVERGGGCRATYFNHARDLRPPVAPPGHIVAGSPPADGEAEDVLDMLRRRHGELGSG